jgi:hypothetical protein
MARNECMSPVVGETTPPLIGIARLGNSESEYFLAPDVTDPPGFYRDATGALKRQAVRFRVYGPKGAGRPG